jgi:hypothetical protein
VGQPVGWDEIRHDMQSSIALQSSPMTQNRQCC